MVLPNMNSIKTTTSSTAVITSTDKQEGTIGNSKVMPITKKCQCQCPHPDLIRTAAILIMIASAILFFTPIVMLMLPSTISAVAMGPDTTGYFVGSIISFVMGTLLAPASALMLANVNPPKASTQA